MANAPIGVPSTPLHARQDIQDNWFLVSVVNNDYKGESSLWTLFEAIRSHRDFDIYSQGSLSGLPKRLSAARPEELQPSIKGWHSFGSFGSLGIDIDDIDSQSLPSQLTGCSFGLASSGVDFR